MRAGDRRLRAVSGGLVSQTCPRTVPMRVTCGFAPKPVKSEAQGAGPP
jgi:hypothetical protein